MSEPHRVLHLICSTGFYGAERWILALCRNHDHSKVHAGLALVREPGQPADGTKLGTLFDGSVVWIDGSGRFDPRLISRLCGAIRDQKIEIVHSHGYKSDVLALVAARLMRIRCISTPHGFEPLPALSRLRRSYHHIGLAALRHFDMVAPLSPAIRQEVLEARVPDARTHLVMNGVDMEEINAARDDSIVKSGVPIALGYVGQLIKRKRVGHLVRMLSMLSDSGVDATLTIIGDGPQRLELEALATDMGQAEKIRFLGYREDRLAQMQRFDVFVFASELEGVPRVMMEAMGLGLPVVAYKIDGVDTLVEHGHSGLLCEDGDTIALANACRQIADEPELGRKLGREARRRVETSFSGTVMAQHYEQLYDRLLTGESISDGI